MKIFNFQKLKLKNILHIFKRNRRNTNLSENKNYRLYKNEPKNTKLGKKRKTLHFKLDFSRFHFLKKSHLPYIFGTFLLILIITFILFLSPLFTVKYIIITKDNLTDMNIAYKAVDDFRGKSIFSIEEKDILKKLKNYQENIKSIKLDISYPNKLDIAVESYKELFQMSIGGKYFLLLENGSLVPKKNKEIQKINIVNAFWKNNYLDYKQVFSAKRIAKIVEIIEKLKDNIIWIQISSVNFYSIEREVHIQINEKTLLIFSLSDDISVEEQVRNYIIFTQEYKVTNKEEIIYIDLRIKDNAFICGIEEEYRCRLNLKNNYPEVEITPEIIEEPLELEEATETPEWEANENTENISENPEADTET